MHKLLLFALGILLVGMDYGHAGQSEPILVRISKDVAVAQVRHGDELVTVKRNQDVTARLSDEFSKTSRKCPPFCAQPMEAAPGVITIGEMELITFMTTKLNDHTGLLVDARTPDWYARGTIPGSINVPYTDVIPSLGAEEIIIAEVLTLFGAKETAKGWDFSEAKDLVLWCNGPWCGQSPTAIRGLISLGYPVEKIFYYRGGMQLWRVFGLTVLPPAHQN
ncbi:MAG: rhodanese-like domain-containing protein [Magnetococcales bacterium]|nr:rhodanese-like domain-containing protein [Magnetococcales bacterium]